jgi:DNA polymerase-3 subunit beta
MVRLDFWPSSEMTISGDDDDFGMGACNKIFIDEFTAEPFSIGLKGSTLLNIIQKMDGAEVYLNMKDPSHAITIEPAKHIEGQEILMLQMPMILND